jgi:ComF family protein
VLDLLFPQRCLVCRRLGAQLCSACRSALRRIEPPLCSRCGAPTAWPVARCRECEGRRIAFASASAAVVYDEAVRAFVGGWKERGLRGLAALAADVVVECVPRPEVNALATVPADTNRRLHRGHHPAARLAQELGKRWEIPVAELLERTRPLPRQRGLPLAERRRNVRGAFQATRHSPPRICLVDDVYTSGATAAEAASALRKAGASHVEVVSFARAVR